MQDYHSNKIKTAWDITRRIKNWPTAFGLRIFRNTPGLRLLAFRNGLNIACRQETRDWDVVHEILFAGGYGLALNYLETLPGRPLVLDLGANIGVFSLSAAHRNREAIIHAFEPGPPNYRLFEMNVLANPDLGDRIHLHKEAVGGASRTTQWYFDANNPGGSNLFGAVGKSFEVRIRAFKDLVAQYSEPISLMKIDIECAEFELLESSSDDDWRKVHAVAIEIHGDPAQKITRENFLQRFSDMGFEIKMESVISYFMLRK